MKKIFYLLVIFFCVNHAQEIKRLDNAHSHNDYNRKIPLFEALNCGFTSIEADIFLINDSLFIAHSFDEIEKNRTLKKMYLNPLREITKGKNKFTNLFPVNLLIDIKSEEFSTYLALEKLLKEYEEIITVYKNNVKHQKQINIIISGNRPINFIKNQKYRFAAIDGRLEDINKNEILFPLISDSMEKILAGEKNRDSIQTILMKLSKQVNQNNKKLRIWGAPDNNESWKIQKEAKLDFIGTDKPEKLKQFLVNKRENNNE